MIHTLDILDPTKTPVKWFPSVEALATPRTFTFKPGLNVSGAHWRVRTSRQALERPRSAGSSIY